MQPSLKTPLKSSIENHPNYRLVQLSERQGRVGFVLPQANVVVPDKQVVRSLKEIIHLYQQLKPRREGRRVGGSFPTHRSQQLQLL